MYQVTCVSLHQWAELRSRTCQVLVKPEENHALLARSQCATATHTRQGHLSITIVHKTSICSIAAPFAHCAKNKASTDLFIYLTNFSEYINLGRFPNLGAGLLHCCLRVSYLENQWDWFYLLLMFSNEWIVNSYFHIGFRCLARQSLLSWNLSEK